MFFLVQGSLLSHLPFFVLGWNCHVFSSLDKSHKYMDFMMNVYESMAMPRHGGIVFNASTALD
jgi:hypothetical protein